MFQKVKKIWPVLAVMGIVGLLLASCDIQKATDAINKVNLVIGLKPITTTVSGQFLDAKTGDLIPNVTLSFMGSESGDVIDMFSDPISKQKFSGGFATFGINNNVTPSASNPVSFTVVAQAPGYVTTYKKIILSDTTHFGFLMTMTNTNNPPAGVTSGSNTSATTTSSGAVTQSYSVQTQSNNGAPPAAGLSVQANTIMTDANGNTLTGTLTTNMTYYADSSRALQQMPGGFTDGALPTGFAQITITDGSGHKAAHFSKPVTINSEISSKTINPVTGAYVKNGDSLEVDSYDENTGQWTKEGMAYLTGPNSDGNYDASFPIHHLSSYRWTIANVEQSTHGATLKIIRNGNNGTLYGDVEISYSTGSIFSGNYHDYDHLYKFTIPAGTANNQITLPPPGVESVPKIKADVAIFPASGSQGFGAVVAYGDEESVDLGNPGETVTFSIPAPKTPPIDVTFTLEPKCSDPGKQVHVTSIPTAEVYYQNTQSGTNANTYGWVDAGTPDWQFDKQTSVLSGGTLKVSSLYNGSTYTFKTAFDGKTYSKDVTITGSQMTVKQTISGSYCK